MTKTTTKTSPGNITLFHLYYFAIILTRLTSTEMANYPGTKLVGVAFKLRKKMKNSLCSHSPKNLEFGHFTLLFCRERQEMYQNENAHAE